MSVLIYQTSGGFRFNLQCRAVSREDEFLLSRKPAPLPIEGNVSISANIGLNYCPFCGKELRTLVRSSTKEYFETVAEEHKNFDAHPY